MRASVPITLQASQPSLAALDRRGYTPALQALLSWADAEGLPQALPFGSPRTERRAEVVAVVRDLSSAPAKDRDAVLAVTAGLWLRFDFMDEAHAVAQDLETRDGSYWHAIVHRREPDPGNARYWFHRVGEHPVFPTLLADARILARAAPRLPKPVSKLVDGQRWDPDAFVAACSAEPADDPLLLPVLLGIQRREWDLLFHHAHVAAFGG